MTSLVGYSTRADAVANHLRRAILSGEYAAGARLRQADLAEQLGVSTTPVREALILLLREGFLTSDSHKGMMVRQPNMDELSELYEIRIALEPLATAKAAAVITDEQVAELKAVLVKMRKLAAGKAADAEEQHGTMNSAFHGRIYEIAGSARLTELIMSLRAQSSVYVRLFPVEVVSLGTSDTQHAEILDALESRSAKRAQRAMRHHLEFNEQHIAGQLREATGATKRPA